MSEDTGEHNAEQGLRGRIGGWFGRRRGEHGVRHSIAALVREAAEAQPNEGEPPELDRQERVLIANVLRLRETSADDVMVQRADIVAMPADLDLAQALDLMRRENHSRMPVYRDQLDEIVGMVHLKDIVGYAGPADSFDLRALMRQPLMVAPQVPVLDLLLQMRQKRTHMALVVDEYGGIDGLVTIEDLVETIVDARLPVEEFEERVGEVLTEDERDSDIQTVGGLVFTLAGHVPARGEILSHESGIEFRVLEADARHIRKLRVRLPEPAPDDAENAKAARAEDAA
jgi:magnesium and cobalt transporter